MKKYLALWQFAGFTIAAALGSVLHFLYDWTGAVFLAPFSAVNESTWEHMKLLFWPMLLFAIVESRPFRDRRDFWCIKLKGILLGLVIIPILFYTYNGAIGRSPDWLNIAIFFLAAAIAYLYEARVFNRSKAACKHPKLAITILCLIALLFVAFTFRTPPIGIFADPITGGYGI